MCTGHPPFRAESAVAVLRRVSDDEPRAIREVNPEVPEWLEAIVARLLAKDPGRRYHSASDVADLLGRCLAHVQQPLAAPLPEELAARAVGSGPPCGRRRSAWTLAVGLGAVAIAVVCTALVATPGRPRPRLRPAPDAATGGAPPGRPVPEGSLAPRGPFAARRAASAAQPGPDELTQQLEEAWGRTAALQADLQRGGAGSSPGDPVSATARGLSERARALEQAIGPGGPARAADRP
jgi:hypothetical protein